MKTVVQVGLGTLWGFRIRGLSAVDGIGHNIINRSIYRMECSLAWDNISKAVGGVPLLRCCSGLVHSGEIVALMGLSGCGKTTLMKVLSGEGSYSSGCGKEGGGVGARVYLIDV